MRLRADGLLTRFNAITANIPTLARAETANLLASSRLAVSPTLADKRLATSDLLRRSALSALSQRADERKEEGLGHDDVLDIARRFGDPRLGEGFDALVQAADEATRADLQDAKLVQAVADSGVAPQLDVAIRALPVSEQAGFAVQLRDAAASADPPKQLARLAGLLGEPT